jgi:glutathione S-transferase
MAPSYTLYGCPNTASTGIHWLLVHLEQSQGIKFDFSEVSLPKGEQKTEAYAQINRKQRVPTLVAHPESGASVTVTETGACALVLAEEHPQARLKPALDAPLAERAAFDEAFVFVVNSILPALRDWMYADKDGAQQYAHGVRLLTLDRLKMMYGVLDQLLVERKYLAGNHPTAVDYIFCATMSWDGFIYALSRRFKNIRRFDDEMRASKSFQELAKREDLSIGEIKDWEEPYVTLSAQL